MEEPQILEALKHKTVYELNVDEKIKILNCLMHQILSFASVRDTIDERFGEYVEAKAELREHKIAENKRIKAQDVAEKQKRRDMRMQKKEDDLKAQEKKTEEDKQSKEATSSDAHLTERQKLALQSQKEKEEKKKQKEEEMRREEAAETEQLLLSRIGDLQRSCGLAFLGRDRAYRRYWLLDSGLMPGLFVEHDDDFVGACLPEPTSFSSNAGPMDENAAMRKVTEILDNRGKSPDEKSSSDKENDENKIKDSTKTYSKKNAAAMKQKILSAKNGAVTSDGTTVTETVSANGTVNAIPSGSQPPATPTVKKPVDEAEQAPWGACLADALTCPVHSTIMPRTHWSYFSSIEDVDRLIDALNPRGFRESELKEKLKQERERIAKNLRRFGPDTERRLNLAESVVKEEGDAKEVVANGGAVESSFASTADLTLRDQILELEEKIFFGNLGSLKVRERAAWQSAIQSGGYDKQCDSLSWGGGGGTGVQDTPFESRVESEAPSRDQVF
jgi:bromodomain adjacent to zinc finger domain protein 1A